MTGNLAVYGTAVQEGVHFYREKNITQPDPVLWEWADNEGNGKKTVLNLRLQLNSKPDLYVSGVKPQYMIIEDALKRAAIPNFAWVFDSYLRANNPHNFRVWVNFREEAEVFLRLQESKKAKRVAILYVMTPSVEEQQQKIIIPELNKRGLKDVLVIPYQIDNLDFNSIALKIKQYSPDLLFLSGFQHNFVPMIKALRNLSLIKEGNTFATYDLLDAAGILSPHELLNLRGVVPRFVLSKESHVVGWKDEFRKRFNHEPLYTHAYAYDMAAVIYSIVGKTNHRLVSQRLQEATLTGITGTLKFDADGDVRPELTVAEYSESGMQEVRF